MLHVEHIHPKGLPKYHDLIGRWDNFLLACATCNSAKSTFDVKLEETYLPDRDNTVVAFSYLPDGTIRPSGDHSVSFEIAERTLALTGLSRPFPLRRTAKELLEQRMQTWLQALDAKADIAIHIENISLRRQIVATAVACGHFSIWMTVFADDADMRNQLVDAFPGTRDSGCFALSNGTTVSPAPNPDKLPHGGKV